MTWEAVLQAIHQPAKAIVWDGCHKIYVAMDDGEMATFRRMGYGDGTDDSLLIPLNEGFMPEDAFNRVHSWYHASCSLVFISAVSTVPEGTDPNEGFRRLIPQSWDGDDDE